MIHPIFFKQNEQNTHTVTFNVKKYFIDVDNDFVETFDSNLSGITVEIVGEESKLTGGDGVASFTLAQGTYIYKVYNMTAQLTTIKGELIVGETPETVECRLFDCLYTPTVIENMITNEDFIPVASATELDGLRNDDDRRMGQGTIFDSDDVVTGLDKKYVQVNDIDFEGGLFRALSPATPDFPPFSGIYYGNLLTIKNIDQISTIPTYSVAIFGVCQNAVLKDIISINNRFFVNQSSQINRAGNIASDINNTIIDNCAVIDGYCGKGVNQFGARIGLICVTAIESHISNCYAINSEIENNTLNPDGDTSRCGFIISGTGTNTLCEKVYSINNKFITPTAFIGGIIGVNSGSTLRNSYNLSDVEGLSATGGAVGRNFGTVEKVYSAGNVIGTTSVGGLIGSNTGTITNSYYDTDTSNQSDTGKGLPRTTLQLKNGAADSFINPDGTTDLTEDPANAMFTGWDNTIWDFTDTTKYPELL